MLSLKLKKLTDDDFLARLDSVDRALVFGLKWIVVLIVRWPEDNLEWNYVDRCCAIFIRQTGLVSGEHAEQYILFIVYFRWLGETPKDLTDGFVWKWISHWIWLQQNNLSGQNVTRANPFDICLCWTISMEWKYWLDWYLVNMLNSRMYLLFSVTWFDFPGNGVSQEIRVEPTIEKVYLSGSSCWP